MPERILYFPLVCSPYILSIRISDLGAFSIIQSVCSGCVILGKEPSAVPKSFASYRKEEEVRAIGFPRFAVYLSCKLDFRAYLHRKGPVPQTKVKCSSVGTFPESRPQHQTFLRGKKKKKKKASFLAEVLNAQKKNIKNTQCTEARYFCPLLH